jgi:hypothetical protein
MDSAAGSAFTGVHLDAPNSSLLLDTKHPCCWDWIEGENSHPRARHYRLRHLRSLMTAYTRIRTALVAFVAYIITTVKNNGTKSSRSRDGERIMYDNGAVVVAFVFCCTFSMEALL